MRFETVAILDWSSASGPQRGANSIWLGLADKDGVRAENIATRAEAERRLDALISDALSAGERLLVGADFGFGYPTGFAGHLTGDPSALNLWDWLADRIADDEDHASNYRDVAGIINASFAGAGPFWGNGRKADVDGLPRLKPALPDGLATYRETERAARDSAAQPKTCWQLAGAGAVGAQTLTGLPVLQRLRRKHAGALAVWPFEPADTPIVLAEVYPSLLAQAVKVAQAREPGLVADEAQVRLLAAALLALSADDTLAPLFSPPADEKVLREEGWILGAGQTERLRAAVPTVSPPPLADDCFTPPPSAMPRGVDWVPVDEALARLRAALQPVAAKTTVTLANARGRILADDAVAVRANPPHANAAVDGYGFAHSATGDGAQTLPLVDGRAAAGQPFSDTVPHGSTIRILTGAMLPAGVDTVILEEDTTKTGSTVAFNGTVKAGANTRRAGEDVDAGQPALPAGHRLRAPDLALLTALGHAKISVRQRLRVGVLSTGDEIVAVAGDPAQTHQIWDANRPMLLSLIEGWGYEPVDLGHVDDDPVRIASRFDEGAACTDAILVSGGASAGDEDHVSALLGTGGTLSSWRIAMKPGRPLALAQWKGRQVFGLPGNPVAAFVCALFFARPALSLLAGAGWTEPQGVIVPAAFSKSKKAGRREYLRARLNANGEAEIFRSEGSGRISGLSWATGLVELPDEAMTVSPGTPVRFLSYAELGAA